MLETRPDLEIDREKALLGRWTTKRLSAERTIAIAILDPSLHLIEADARWEAHLLDQFLVRVPERFRTFSLEEAQSVLGTLSLLHGFLEEIRAGGETPTDILIAKGGL